MSVLRGKCKDCEHRLQAHLLGRCCSVRVQQMMRGKSENEAPSLVNHQEEVSIDLPP